MAEFSDVVLDLLSKRESVESLKLSEELSVDHQKIVGAIKSLQSLGEVIECEQISSARLLLTAEGELIAKCGGHEAVIFNIIPPEGITKDELFSKVGSANAKVGFSKAMAFKWITMEKKADGEPLVFRKVDKIEDLVQKICQNVQERKEITKEQREECKKRKLIEESTIVSYIVRKGPQFTTNLEKLETEITEEMIASGSWDTMKFKKYNFNAKGVPLSGGHLNPLLKVRSQFRQIFLEMGFSEMPTNNFVESSFWNFDALFQPQQHPARDAHDTFFLSDPAEAKSFPMDYLERVKTVHSVGGYGSQGHKCDWKVKEAAKNIMRTHTTGVSARMLYQLATKPTFEPSKFFSIDRVFRNETLDATHLAEFHQIEGLVADYGLTLGDLMGYIQVFFKKYGMEKLKFKPAYNPYTEPSMEIFSYHEGLKKWIEIGNSGVFRPEMLLPMGLPKDVSVIAWGLSLERPTMIKYKVENIRDLFGHKIDLQKVYDNPICRLGDCGDSVKLVTEFPEQAVEGSNQPLSDLLLLDKRMHRVIDRLRRLRCRVDDYTSSLIATTSSEQSLTTNHQLEGSPQASAQTSCLSKCPVSTTSFLPNDLKDLKRPTFESTQISHQSGTLQTENRELSGKPFLSKLVKCPGRKSNDIVVNCDPNTPSASLFILLDALSSLRFFHVDSLVHSSLKFPSEKLEEFKKTFQTSDQGVPFSEESGIQRVTVIWKDLGGFTNSSMSVGLNMHILGEKSIAKHLFHLIEEGLTNNDVKSVFPGGIQNPHDAVQLTIAEDIIDSCQDQLKTKDMITKLQSALRASSGPLLFGASVSLADVISWSALLQSSGCNTTAEIQRWSKYCSQLPHFPFAAKMLEMCPK